ncbi:FAD-binding oxidoreductase [Nitrosomonas sp.]|uniref:FAD-binding oxidoreductase n=1 Tax=Nitrosomonas sp. TaxID=42353 RepID=UPI001DE40E47|nr:FAD-binding oxidoreductase [Nitrosomonas sp.]MCB1948252.1 FAD-binding oxidoreductase [Nitrosomonas sp.]
MTSESFKNALKAWQDILGEDYVELRFESLAKAATATFSTNRQIPAILRPFVREEIQDCIKIANRYKVPIYPVSTGKNWGNGSSVPSADNCVVMHLGRMNRIADLDPKQACVTIEPGVTQGQLASFLSESKAGLWLDVTGASPSTSIIGNIMERGVGYSAYGNRASQVCRMEVVLPNGEFIVTGFGKYANAQAGLVYQWGLGPSLDGLFTQSNLGIVTRLTLWLMPEPEAIECFYFSSKEEKKLEEIINALQPLRLRGVLQSGIHIANKYKVLNAYFQYPWELTEGRAPLPVEVLEELSKVVGSGEWNGSGAFYGTRRQIKESKRLLRNALNSKVDRLSFVNDRHLAIVKRYPEIVGKLLNINLSAMLPVIKALDGMQKGIPSEVTMSTVYWRKKQRVPEIKDPDMDRCGLIWYSPVAPLDGMHAMNMYEIAKKIMLVYAFEPLISFAFMTERALCCVIAIVYDRDVEGEDARAMQCHYEIVSALSDLGYYPYRLGIQNMMHVLPGDQNYLKLIQCIKHTLDPNNILSPNRYEF